MDVATRLASMRDAPAPRRGGGPVDIVVAIALAAFTLPLTIASIVQRAADVPAWVPAVTIALAVVLHVVSAIAPRWPVAALAAGAAVMLALAFLPFDSTASAAMLPSSLAFLLIVLTAARVDDLRVGRIALGVGIAGAFIVAAAHRVVATTGPLRDDLMIQAFAVGSLLVAVVAAWALGRLARLSRLRERERERARIREAIADERRSISRDLHDVIAHSMTVMIAQAEAGAVHARGDPGAAVAALERIGEHGREAMRDLRAMLRVLDDEDAPLRPTSLVPAPGLDGLPALVDSARAEGRELSLAEGGERRPLARDAELAAYRAVQEAITNAIRHTRPPVRIQVELAWRDDVLELTVADDGGGDAGARRSPGRQADRADQHVTQAPLPPTGGSDADGVGERPSGRGLIGMRERVERAGGQLRLVTDGGWTVGVTLPTLGAVRRERGS